MDSHYDVIVVGGRVRGRRYRDAACTRRPAGARHRGRPTGHRHACPRMRSCVAACCNCTAGVCSTRSSPRYPGHSCDPVQLRRRHRDGRNPPRRRNIRAARPASNGARRAAAGRGPRGRRRDPQPGSGNPPADKRRQGTRRRGRHTRDRHVLPCHRDAHRRRRRARLDGRAGGRTRSFTAEARRRARSSTDTSPDWRATATTGRIAREPPRVWCRPVTAWPVSGPGPPPPGSTPSVRTISRPPSGCCWPRRRPRSRDRSPRHRPPVGSAASPVRRAIIRSCGGPGWALVGDAGVLQGPHHRARHHRRPARRGASRPRGARRTHAADGPSSTAVLDYQHTRDRLSETSYSTSPSASRATSGTSPSCVASCAR